MFGATFLYSLDLVLDSRVIRGGFVQLCARLLRGSGSRPATGFDGSPTPATGGREGGEESLSENVNAGKSESPFFCASLSS